MPLEFSHARPLLQQGLLQKLFVEELGWEPHRQTLTLDIDSTSYTLSAFAEKKGFIAWLCRSDGNEQIGRASCRERV